MTAIYSFPYKKHIQVLTDGGITAAGTTTTGTLFAWAKGRARSKHHDNNDQQSEAVARTLDYVAKGYGAVI